MLPINGDSSKNYNTLHIIVMQTVRLTCPSCIAVKRNSSLVLEPLCTAYQYTAPGARSWTNIYNNNNPRLSNRNQSIIIGNGHMHIQNWQWP